MCQVSRLESELHSSHGSVEMIEFESHLRDEILHSSNRIDDLDRLRVRIVTHFHRSAKVLDHPTSARWKLNLHFFTVYEKISFSNSSFELVQFIFTLVDIPWFFRSKNWCKGLMRKTILCLVSLKIIAVKITTANSKGRLYYKITIFRTVITVHRMTNGFK